MARRFLYVTFLLVLVFLFLPIVSYAEKRVAFIIGNSEYKEYDSLTQPVNDAEAVDDALKSLGFEETIVLKDGTREQMIQSLEKFIKILDGADVAVFYYSGHGNTINYEEYIVPAKTEFFGVALEAQFLSLQLIQQEMIKRSKLSFVFYDACRNAPNAEIAEPDFSQSKGFRGIYHQNAMMICYATKQGGTAYAGTGTLSPFTEVLLDYICEEKDFEELWYDNIKKDRRLNNPQDRGGYSGIFYFKKPQIILPHQNKISSNFADLKITESDSIITYVDYLISQLDFREAVNWLNKIPNSYHNYADIKDKISRYSFCLKEQYEGRIVSQKLAKTISSYGTLESFHDGYSRLAYVINNNVYNGFVSTKGDVFFFSSTIPQKWAQFSNGMSYCSDGLTHLTYLLDSNLNSVGLAYKLGSDGGTIHSFSYCSNKNFSEGLLAIQNIETGKWGYINKAGEIIIKCKYDVASNFSKGLAFVRKGNKNFYIDKQGKTIISNCSDIFHTNFSDNFKWIKYNSNDTEYVITSRFGDKHNRFPKNFQKNGINVIVDYIMPSCYDISCVKAHYLDPNGKSIDFYFYLKGDGTLLYNFEMFDLANSFSEKKAVVWKDGQCGVIDMHAQIVIPYGKYDSIGDFKNGLSIVSKSGKYGFIDETGNVVIDFLYDYAEPFTDVFALVVQNGKFGFVDKYGFSTLTVDVEK